MKNEIIMSEHNSFKAGNLIMYSNKIEYGNYRFGFEEIEHIGWHWLSVSVNGISKETANLSFHITDLDRPIKISKTTILVPPKLVTVYRYVAQETFQNRLRTYTNKLYELGEFTFQGITFYSDGRVRGNGKDFHLKDAKHEPFSITLKSGGLFGARLHIDLLTDKDVILAIFEFILKNPKDPAEIKRNSELRRL
jgi:hypothetical protein